MFNGLLLSVDRVATILCAENNTIAKAPHFPCTFSWKCNILQLLLINFYNNYIIEGRYSKKFVD